MQKMMYYHREHIVTRGYILSKADYEFQTDEQLVALAQHGDDIALEELCRRFMTRKKLSGGVGYYDAQDLLQEGMFGFLSAVRNFSQARGVPFSAYASVCVNNRIKNAQNKADVAFPVAETDDGAQTAAGGAVISPVEFTESSENVSNIISLCERELSETERSVLYCKMTGMSYKDIAGRLCLNEKSVENALGRARKKLRELINQSNMSS